MTTARFKMYKDIESPKSLDQAVELIFDDVEGDIENLHEHIYHIMRNFIAQKFFVAILKTSMNQDQAISRKELEHLFEQVTQRDMTKTLSAIEARIKGNADEKESKQKVN